MMERNKNVMTWDSQTGITEPVHVTVRLQSLNRYKDEQGVDDVDEEDSEDEQ
jgi:hypothetical protein